MKFDSTEETLGYNSRVLLVDGMNTFIRNYCAMPTLDDNGRHIGGMAGFLKSVASAIKTFKPTRAIIVFDGAGGSQRRRKLYPEYKGHRKMVTRLNRNYSLGNDHEEKENMVWQMKELVTILESLPLVVVTIDNIEADDTIAYLSHMVESQGGKSIIYSTDRDFLQLASEQTKIYNPQKRKVYTPQSVVEEYGVHPHNFTFFRAIVGDTSDNIDGVRGVGMKTAVKYISELADGTTEVTNDLLERKFADMKKPPKTVQKLLSERHIIERNIKLMNLGEVNISVDAKMKIVAKFDSKPPTFNKPDLTRCLYRSNIIHTLSNYDEWLRTSYQTLAKYNE